MNILGFIKSLFKPGKNTSDGFSSATSANGTAIASAATQTKACAKKRTPSQTSAAKRKNAKVIPGNSKRSKNSAGATSAADLIGGYILHDHVFNHNSKRRSSKVRSLYSDEEYIRMKRFYGDEVEIDDHENMHVDDLDDIDEDDFDDYMVDSDHFDRHHGYDSYSGYNDFGSHDDFGGYEDYGNNDFFDYDSDF